jgi:hypothetical protein
MAARALICQSRSEVSLYHNMLFSSTTRYYIRTTIWRSYTSAFNQLSLKTELTEEVPVKERETKSKYIVHVSDVTLNKFVALSKIVVA